MTKDASTDNITVMANNALDKSMQIRNQLIDALRNDDGSLPTESSGAQLLLTTLKDNDVTALSRLKLNGDEAKATGELEMQERYLQFLESPKSAGVQGTPPVGQIRDVTPDFTKLPENVYVEGELSDSSIHIEPDEFMAENEQIMEDRFNS